MFPCAGRVTNSKLRKMRITAEARMRSNAIAHRAFLTQVLEKMDKIEPRLESFSNFKFCFESSLGGALPSPRPSSFQRSI